MVLCKIIFDDPFSLTSPSSSTSSPPSLSPSYSPSSQVYREVARTLAQMHSIQLPEGRRNPGVVIIITIIVIIIITIIIMIITIIMAIILATRRQTEASTRVRPGACGRWPGRSRRTTLPMLKLQNNWSIRASLTSDQWRVEHLQGGQNSLDLIRKGRLHFSWSS